MDLSNLIITMTYKTDYLRKPTPIKMFKLININIFLQIWFYANSESEVDLAEIIYWCEFLPERTRVNSNIFKFFFQIMAISS